MNTMQAELDSAYPILRIQLLGVNQPGKESSNASATAGRNLPWLQDVDVDQNGGGDVADDLWDVTNRDLVILDGENVQVGKFNLSGNDLEEADAYATLREMLVDAAMLSQLPWMNPSNPLDVDDSGHVVPLDVLLVVNQIDDLGSHKLPPPTTAEMTQPYYDANGDGDLTPLDPLQIVNFLNDDSIEAEGEWSTPDSRQLSEPDAQPVAEMPVSAAVTPLSSEVSAAGAAWDFRHLGLHAQDVEQCRHALQEKAADRLFTRGKFLDSVHAWASSNPKRLEKLDRIASALTDLANRVDI